MNFTSIRRKNTCLINVSNQINKGFFYLFIIPVILLNSFVYNFSFGQMEYAIRLRRVHPLFFLLLLLAISCAPSRFVKPLEKGQKAINVHLGGPLIGFAGTTIPIPFTSVTGGYGLKENLTVFASIHTTALAFRVFETDIGIVKQLMAQKGYAPAITITPVINMAFDGWEYNFKFWPQIDINAYWHYKQKRNFFYIGLGNWFELSTNKAHNEKQLVHWIYNPHLGHTFVRNKWDYNLEVKYLAPTTERTPNVVDYKGFGSTGAVGVYFSVTRKF